MPRLAVIAIVVGVLAGTTAAVRAEEIRIHVIAHPSRSEAINESDARAIYLKQKLFWDDGRPIVPINREAGSKIREEFSRRLLGQGSRRLAGYWNRRYFEGGQFPPATLASEDAVIRFVAGNRDALGYVATDELDPAAVAVVMTLD